MDDFSGKFCKNGTFPVVRAMKTCFDTPPTTTTTTTKTTAIKKNSITTDETIYIGIATSKSTIVFLNYYLTLFYTILYPFL